MKYLLIIPFTIFLGLFFNSPVMAASKAELNAAGLISVLDYGADPTGVNDSTQAFQNAVNAAYGSGDGRSSNGYNRQSVYVPQGTYIISDTIDMKQNAPHYLRKLTANLIIGSNKNGTFPTILVKKNTPAFNNSSRPKEIFYIWATCFYSLNGGKCPSYVTDNGYIHNGEYVEGDISFNNGIKNLNIVVEKGNPGAVAISNAGAQNCLLENLNINLKSGFAGITGLPGVASVLANINIVGGQYGIKADGENPDKPVLTNITLKNQSKYAVYGHNSPGYIQLTGFRIEKKQAPVIKLKGPVNDRLMTLGSIILIDGEIVTSETSTTPIIDNSIGSPLTLNNVYFKNSGPLIKSKSYVLAKGSSTFTHVNEYLYGESSYGKFMIDGTISPSNTIIKNTEQTISSVDQRPKHVFLEPLSPDQLLDKAKSSLSTKVCNALNPTDNYDIRANSSFNDQPGLQAMVNDPNCRTIFLPKGDYTLKSTLTLGEKTQMIGLSMHQTIFRNAGFCPSSPTPLITTVNSKTATTSLRNIHIKIYSDPKACDWVEALRWQAGSNSVLVDVQVMPTWVPSPGDLLNPKAEVHYTGHGGGKWFGANSFSVNDYVAAQANPKARNFLVEGTIEPLRLYAFNIEDGGAGLTGGCGAEFKNAKNVFVYGAKFEDHYPLCITNSDNIAVFGTGGHAGEFKITDSKNILMTNAVRMIVGFGGTTPHITELYHGQTKTIPYNQAPFLYKRGSVDLSVIKNPGVVGTLFSPKFDLNDDGKVDIKDLIELIKFIFG